MDYGYKDHSHNFAAWTACRAASQKKYRFSVKQGREWLENIDGLLCLINCKIEVPSADEFDIMHRRWRCSIIKAADPREISHGVAAKLINVYLKSALVLPGLASGRKVSSIHPPIDRALLENLRNERPEIWDGPLQAWTNFSSDDYEEVIRKIRSMLLPDQPLWEIEKFWRGYQ